MPNTPCTDNVGLVVVSEAVLESAGNRHTFYGAMGEQIIAAVQQATDLPIKY